MGNNGQNDSAPQRPKEGGLQKEQLPTVWS